MGYGGPMCRGLHQDRTAADFPGTDRHRKGGQIAHDSFRRTQESRFYLLNDRGQWLIALH